MSYHIQAPPFIPTIIAVSAGFLGYLFYVGHDDASSLSFVSRKKKETKQDDSSGSKFMNISVEDTLHLIQNRRTIFPQQYTGQPVSKQIICDMLEAARWAPSHKLTEPWRFIVFHSDVARKELGLYLATQYKNETPVAKFSQAKFEKKSASAERSSCVMAICVQLPSQMDNPLMEEICSVAMAVQNMHLVATANGIGAYWSTGGVYGNFDNKDVYHVASNPSCLTEFLNLENQLCIGWFYIGTYYDNLEGAKPKTWPTGRRKPMDDGVRVIWR